MASPRSAKRRKVETCPELPATSWANVFAFLPLSDVRPARLTCRLLAFDAVKSVRVLIIESPCDLDARVARVFPNVLIIGIYCLLRETGEAGETTTALIPETTSRIVPFLTSFPKLEQCYVFGLDTDRRCIEYCMTKCSGPRKHNELYREMLAAFCGAFQAKALPQDLLLRGVLGATWSQTTHCCSPVIEREGEHCSFCRRICSTFPLNSLIVLSGVRGQADYHHDLCIPPSASVDFMKKRHWTDKCISRALSVYQRPCIGKHLLAARSFEVDDKDYCRRMRKKGASAPEHIFSIPSHRLDRIELLQTFARSRLNGAIKWNKHWLMRKMTSDMPSGGYVLLKATFDRLCGLGFDLDSSDFVLVDPEVESVLRKIPFEEGS